MIIRNYRQKIVDGIQNEYKKKETKKKKKIKKSRENDAKTSSDQ